MNSHVKPVFLTGLAMVAFAANSVIARQALLAPEIGPLSYTIIRMISGAIVLGLLVGPNTSWKAGSWKGALTLLIYAVFFSLAYISLPAGIGALILFASVQMTMIGTGLISGERLSLVQWMGAVMAFIGLVVLLAPGLDAPNVWGAMLMIVSGVGWGLYSLIGRSSQSATADTSGNFVKAALLMGAFAIPLLAMNPEPAPEITGVVLAILSGAVTSGLGYAIWYTALPYLSAIRAGLAQLTVPAIAALGGVLLLAEPVTSRLIVASAIILIGVGIATLSPSEKR